MCWGTIHRNTNKGFEGRWLLVVWGGNPAMNCGAKYWGGCQIGVREDPGWNPGLNDAEALAGPGRFFLFFVFLVLIMARMIGYILTWTTYDTWLQGNKRGYVKDGEEPED